MEKGTAYKVGELVLISLVHVVKGRQYSACTSMPAPEIMEMESKTDSQPR